MLYYFIGVLQKKDIIVITNLKIQPNIWVLGSGGKSFDMAKKIQLRLLLFYYSSFIFRCYRLSFDWKNEKSNGKENIFDFFQ